VADEEDMFEGREEGVGENCWVEGVPVGDEGFPGSVVLRSRVLLKGEEGVND